MLPTINQLRREYGKKFGLNMDSVDRVLGVALGSVFHLTLQMAHYSAFANGGRMQDAHLIVSRIENCTGKS